MKKKRILSLLILSIVFQFANASEDSVKFDDLKPELIKYIEKTMKSAKINGLSIAVVDNQEVIWAEGFGYADEENDVKATAKTVYNVGSMSKLFTATCVMQLAEQGKVDIDESIKNYIPEFYIKSHYEKPGIITPRLLLTHHSGIPGDVLKDLFSENPEPFTNIVSLLNQEYNCTQPNFGWAYSNAGFSLLGVLVERASGENFIDYTQNQLLEKLNMRNSSFKHTPEVEKLFSKGYVRGKEYNEPLARDVPAGMLNSNVLDLANFIKMTFNNGQFGVNQIISANTLNEMQTPQNEDCPLFEYERRMGLGWMLSKNWEFAGGMAHHGGDTYVFHSDLITLPGQKLGVVVLTNSSGGSRNTSKIAMEILTRTLEVRRNLKKSVNEKVEKLKYVKPNADILKKSEGDYIFGGGQPMTIKVDGNKLIGSNPEFKMVFKYNNKGRFTPGIRLLGFIPITMKSQQMKMKTVNGMDVILMYDENNDSSIVGIRTQKPEITDVWKNRFGKYKAVNSNSDFKTLSDFELSEMDGYLIFQVRTFNGHLLKLAIKPLNDNMAIIDGIGRGAGATLIFEEDKIRYSGYELMKESDI
ncbi:serine hydrolase domain-containing protein [Bacteroidota bacterium]